MPGELINSFTLFLETYIDLYIKSRCSIGKKTTFNCTSPVCSKLRDYFISLYYLLLCRNMHVCTNINRLTAEKQGLKRFYPFILSIIISSMVCASVLHENEQPLTHPHLDYGSVLLIMCT